MPKILSTSYYKSFIHSSDPSDSLSQHANSYYLPAIAWAAKVTGKAKWQKYRDERLRLFTKGHYNACQAFHWGSCLPNLADILGCHFGKIFTRNVLNADYQRCQGMLAEYNEPGMVKRLCPESVNPDFKPYIDPDFDQDDFKQSNLGSAFSSTRHHGRVRPTRELNFLISLAALGYKQEKVMTQATGLMTYHKHVPQDCFMMITISYPNQCISMPEE